MATTEADRLRIQLRWMIRRDMPEVLAIEQEAFEFPWSDEDFTRCLRQRNCIGMVAEVGDSVIASMSSTSRFAGRTAGWGSGRR